MYKGGGSVPAKFVEPFWRSFLQIVWYWKMHLNWLSPHPANNDCYTYKCSPTIPYQYSKEVLFLVIVHLKSLLELPHQYNWHWWFSLNSFQKKNWRENIDLKAKFHYSFPAFNFGVIGFMILLWGTAFNIFKFKAWYFFSFLLILKLNSNLKKSCIRETMKVSMFADRSTNTIFLKCQLVPGEHGLLDLVLACMNTAYSVILKQVNGNLVRSADLASF